MTSEEEWTIVKAQRAEWPASGVGLDLVSFPYPDDISTVASEDEWTIISVSRPVASYVVVFDDDPMGICLKPPSRPLCSPAGQREDEDHDCGAVVCAVKGQAKTMGQILVGDIVSKVNGVDVICMPYRDIMDMIRRSPTPRSLEFVSKTSVADLQHVHTCNDSVAIVGEDDQARLLSRFPRFCIESPRPDTTISYEEANKKVKEISKRMGEIGSADTTHPDPEIQQSLREEYYRLEQDMEKYYAALMLTDEFAAEEARKEREWEEENLTENLKALKAIRRCMPVNIKNMSEAELASSKSPNGKVMSRDMARKFKRTNVLELLRMDPKDIMKSHPSSLENLRVTGLTVTERRALHSHLRDIGDSWKAGQNEELTKRKFDWFKTLKETFKTVLNAYNRHVAQYGPADSHPYTTREHQDMGCPLIGKQCPIKADMAPAYNIDLGYPDGDVYMKSIVATGCGCGDAYTNLLREAQHFSITRIKNPRSETLKEHYKNVRLAAEANGACELIDTTMDMVENRQLLWFQSRLKHRLNKTETAATIKVELAEFTELVNEIRLATLKFAERSGMNLSGKRVAANDGPDTRSGVECALCVMLCDSVVECLKGLEERMDEVQASDKRLRAALPAIKDLVVELKDKSAKTLSGLKDKGPAIARKVKTRAEILKEAKEKNAAENGGPAAAPVEAASDAGGDRPPHPLMGARGRSGRGRGRGDLFAAIKGRGGGGDEEGGGGGCPVDLMAAIKARGRGGGGGGRGGGGGGRGGPMDLMSAIKARGRGGGGGRGDEGGPPMDLMAAIKARGRGGGGGRGDMFAAIKARQKD